MSHAAPGQLAAYNSLQDKHLSGYFNNSRMKKHLVKSGLITKKGKIIDEKTYRLNMAKKEHRKHVRDLLATAIIHKALDMERTRQYEIRKRLDEVYKVELVRRVKVDEIQEDDRKKKGDEDILPLLTPRERSARRRKHVRPATAPAGLTGTAQPSEIHYDENTGRLCYAIEGGQETAMNTYLKDDEDPNSPYTRAYPGTYPVPAPPPAGTPRRPRPNSSALARKRTRPVRFHYLARTEPAVAHRVQLQSMAEVTMKFLGPSLMLTNSLFPEDRLCEVMVLQQHCGGSTLCVFRELLPPNTIFTFVSRRHRGAPFGLTFYIDSLQDIRLSSCCEYKHKPGHILGGRNGHFQFVQVEGAAPCYRCQVASGVRDHRPKDSSELESEEKENRTKTFLTQDEANQSRESFDVIITKVDPSENEDQAGTRRITVETTPSGYKMIIPHSAEKVDGSTQTPRDEKEDTVTSNLEDAEKKENTDESSAEEKDKEERDEEKEDEQGEEAATGTYDDEDFEDEDENEEKKESEDEKPKDEEKDSDKDSDKEEDKEEDKEDEPKTDDYKDDFDSDKEEPDKESADEAKQDDSDDDEVDDETEKKDDVKEEDKDEEEEVEVEDETEKQEDKDSVHDSESDMKPSRNVSFDEDVKIINADDDAADVEDEFEEQDNKALEHEKPEEIPEVPEDDTEKAVTSPNEPEMDDGPGEAEKEMDDSPKEVKTKNEPEPEVDDSPKSEPEVDGSGDAEPEKESEEPTTTSPDENEQDKENKKEDEKENDKNENESEKTENEKEREGESEKEAEKEKQDESKDDKDDPEKDESEKTKAEEVKDAVVEDSVDGSSAKPDDSLEIVSPEPTESDSSSDSSSSSSSSDSDSDDEKDVVDEPDHDPGKDPDLVAEKLPEQALKVVGVTPGTKHEGSIQPLVEDKKDIELTSLVLDSEQVDELAGIIEKKEDMGSITLRNTEINDESIEKLVEVLKKSSSVKMLNLNVNRVGPQGAQHIADLIRESKSLRMLLLHGNPLQDEGVHHILDAIIRTTDTAVNNLDLGDCKMKDDGAKDVARLLLNNTTITDLTISGNNIGLSGWRIISSALEQNNTLKSLSLDFSNLGDDEAVILAEGIKENKGLRSLDLEGNRIGNEGGRSLLEAVKANSTLVDLTLMPMNEISKDICDEIKGILEERSKSRVSSASSSISSLLSRNRPSSPLNEEDVGRPSIGSLNEKTNQKEEVETSKENEVSSSVDKDNEDKTEDSLDDPGKSPSEVTRDEDSTLKETVNRETTSEENKEQNDKEESSENKKETVDNSNDDQKS